MTLLEKVSDVASIVETLVILTSLVCIMQQPHSEARAPRVHGLLTLRTSLMRATGTVWVLWSLLFAIRSLGVTKPGSP